MTYNRLSSARLAAFVSPEVPLNAMFMVVVVFVPPFYAGSMGLGLSTVGLVYALTKLWDVVTDPVFGVLSDRWHTPWGRRQPWMIVAVPILCVCTYMTFIPGDTVTVAYFAFWMLVLYIGWTIASVSHISWAAELSTEYHERSRISAYKQAAALIGALSFILMIGIYQNVTNAGEHERMALMGYVLIVALPICVFAALSAVREQTSAPAQGAEKQSLKTLSVMLKNKPLRLLLGANILIGIAAGSHAGMMLFFVEDALKLGRWAAFAIVPLIVSGLLFLPICLMLARRFGKHRTLCYVLIYQMVANLLFLVIPAGSLAIAFSTLILLGTSQAIGVFIPRAIMADVADVETAESGVQQTGLYMSLLQTSSKIASALAIGLAYPVLSLVGFDPAPDAINSEQALFGLRAMLVAFPGVAFFIVVLMMWNFPLNEETQLQLRERVRGLSTTTGAVSLMRTRL